MRMNPFRYSCVSELLRGFIYLAAHILVVIFFLRTFVIGMYTIPSESMKNNLLVGDHVLVDLVSHRQPRNGLERILFPDTKLRRGMVIAFHPPGSPNAVFVKRLVALPGDRVGIRNDHLILNGKFVREPYVLDHRDNDCDRVGVSIPEKRIPPNYLYCLGDNRLKSNDSRYWGVLPRKNIIGIPWRIIWSIRSEPGDYKASGFLDYMNRMATYAINFLFRTRWVRTTRRIQNFR